MHIYSHTQIDGLQAKLSGFLPKLVDFKAVIEEINQRGEREAKQREELLRQTAEKLEQEKKAKEKEEEEKQKRDEGKVATATTTAASKTTPTTSGAAGSGQTGTQSVDSTSTECKLF